ncbi:MAG: M20/M25/M40 family metallo-hydrolase [Ruthenibacterium lactatiformans]
MNTMTDALKRAACAAIDAQAQRLTAFGRDILAHPELGYKETRTAGKVLEAFASLGLTDVTRPARTGVKGWLWRGAGPRVAVIGELDAVLSPGHPFADKATGAAHACGHNAQLASMLGCAVGLRAVADSLAGSVCLLAAPAEEYVEIGWRAGLRRAGEVQYLGGKQQLIAEGAFDDIDMAMMVHSETDAPQPRAVVAGAAGGFIGKELRFLGKEAHAGGAPWEGVNALNAASSPSRPSTPTVRPSATRTMCVCILSLQRAGPGEHRARRCAHGERCACRQRAGHAHRQRQSEPCGPGAAYAVGARVEIDDMPGYLPLAQNAALSELFAANVPVCAPGLAVERGLPFCGSTDMGDVSYLLPVIQPTVSGFSGAAHSRDFAVADEALAYLAPAKLMAATVIDLLAGGAAKGRSVLADAPRRTRHEYSALWRDILAQPGEG